MHILIWNVDSSFAVHDDFHSHTDGTLMLGQGAVTNVSAKQKVNTRSLTEAEVVGVDKSKIKNDSREANRKRDAAIEAQDYVAQKKARGRIRHLKKVLRRATV